jgi:hypothetical protein
MGAGCWLGVEFGVRLGAELARASLCRATILEPSLIRILISLEVM